jgi:uncharacterized protein (TIGR03083 family)
MTTGIDDDKVLVERLGEVWPALDELGGSLAESEWELATDCPGWSVKDQFAHLTHIEGRLLGRPDPDDDLPESMPHVKNEFGRVNEVFVASRRAWSGAEVLAEFREATRERLAALRAYAPGEFDADSWTPVGPGTVRELLPFRMFDAWTHEQDVRRAVGRPGDLDTPVAEAALGMMVGAMPFVVGRKVRPREGTVVVFSLSSPLARDFAVGVVDGRGVAIDGAPDPTVRLTMSTETFGRLSCGRVAADDVLASGELVLDGDVELGRSVAGTMDYVF